LKPFGGARLSYDEESSRFLFDDRQFFHHRAPHQVFLRFSGDCHRK
jgi:hypothetical protein